MRVVAIVAVVLIHTVPGGSVEASYETWGVDAASAINQAARFAVPFFLVASGYFAGLRKGDQSAWGLGGIVRRIVPAFLVWALVYLLVTDGGVSRLARPYFLLVFLATGGPGYHLWFLPALGFGLVCLASLRRLAPGWAMIAVPALLYGLGLAIGPYKLLSLPISPAASVALARTLCAPLFVAIGDRLALSGLRPSLGLAAGVLLGGLALHLGEAYALDQEHVSPFVWNDFLLGTVPFGLGVFLVALRWPIRGAWPAAVAGIGVYSLGIYAIHLLFVMLLDRAIQPATLGGCLVLAAGVIAGSIPTVLALSRVRLLRPILM